MLVSARVHLVGVPGKFVDVPEQTHPPPPPVCTPTNASIEVFMMATRESHGRPS